MMNRDCLRFFIVWLAEQGRSNETIRAYRADIEGFLNATGNVTVGDFGPVDIATYLEGLKGSHKQTTWARKASSLRVFFSWLSERTGAPTPALTVVVPRAPVSPQRILTDDECRSLLHTVRNNPRLKAIVEVMLGCGVRLNELVRLRRDDFIPHSDSVDDHAWLRVGESPKDRVVEVRPSTEAAVQAYLDKRSDASPYLFVTRTGNPLTDRGVRYLVKDAERRARIQNASVKTLAAYGRRFLKSKGPAASPYPRQLLPQELHQGG